MIENGRRRIQFVSDVLVDQIIIGEKTASVVTVEGMLKDEDEYNHALIVGGFYDVFNSEREKRCTIRITGMELCQWDNIPEKLWRGETNRNAAEFREDHQDYFDFPGDDFEFVAYYFQRVNI